jgi:hypothetical protein
MASQIFKGDMAVSYRLGERVKMLLDNPRARAIIPWDGKNEEGSEVSSGFYWHRMIAGDFVQIKRVLFQK